MMGTTVDTGDILSISLLTESHLDTFVTVQIDGRISFGPVQGLSVRGKELAEITTELESKLKKWFKNPKVHLQLVEHSRRFRHSPRSSEHTRRYLSIR